MRFRINEYLSPATTGSGLFIFILCLVLASSPAGAQITTNTALPISSGGGIFRVQTKVLRSSGDPTGADRELTVLAVPFVVVYGLTSRWAAFGIVPLLNKKLGFQASGGRIERTVSGLADSRVFLRYTVYQKDRRGSTLRIAPFAGIQVPTGSQDASDNLGILPKPLQLGSGSWSPLVGTVVTRQTFAWQIDVSVAYQFNNEVDGFRFGNEARFDFASKIRLLPRDLGDHLPNFIYANLESNVIWRGQNEIDGIKNENSGGTVWFMDPGIQFISRRMIVETAVQIPIVQELHGTALENDFIFVLSVRMAF